MKILLIRPGAPNIIASVNVINLEPLEMEYLYTVGLEENCQCRIFDALLGKENLRDVLAEFQPDMAVIGGYITQEDLMLATAETVKSANPHTMVVVGGVHAQVNYERFYKDSIDIIVHSASLQPFRELLRLGSFHPRSRLAEIKGICYNDQQHWAVNSQLLIDPDDLPIPDRSHFNSNKHLYRYLGYSPCAIVKTAYGCPYSCSFCYCKNLNGGHYAVRGMELVIEEIEGIDCSHIHIVDDTFLVDVDRVRLFIKLIKEKRISKKFIMYSRADFVVENQDLIHELAEIGVIGIIVGLEAIDDTTLKGYGKQCSEDVNLQCVEILKNNDIDCLALFIIDIGATKGDFDRLGKWIGNAKLKYASVSIFTPIPGTLLYEELKEKLTTDRMQYWDFLHLVLEPTNMSRKSFYLAYYKLFLKLMMIGKKSGVYDFADMQYIRNKARDFFAGLMKGL